MEKLAFLECQSTIQDTKIGMLPGQCGQVLLHMWGVAHMETLFIGREPRGWKQDYTDLSLHCAKTRYLQSVLSTFIKLQHNPESTDWKQYFLHFNYRRSWLDRGSSLAAVSFPDQPAKTKFKICTNLLTYFAFQQQHRESCRHNNNFRLAGPRLAPSLRTVDNTLTKLH